MVQESFWIVFLLTKLIKTNSEQSQNQIKIYIYISSANLTSMICNQFFRNFAVNWIELNRLTLFKVSYVIVKLHNRSHLLKVCLNNANRPKIIMTIISKIKQIKILKIMFERKILTLHCHWMHIECLMLHCHCEGIYKIPISFQTLVSKKETTWRPEKPQSNNYFLWTTSSSHCME